MAAIKRRRSGLVHERSGGPTEWYTPAAIFDALGIEFDLDPCSPGPLVVPWIPARTHYTQAENGLTQPWHGRVWLNPPYGPGLDRWLRRFCAHRNGIALVFARTDTQWFHTYAVRADAVCFTRGRIAFVSPATLSDHCGGPGSFARSRACASQTDPLYYLKIYCLGERLNIARHGSAPRHRLRE